MADTKDIRRLANSALEFLNIMLEPAEVHAVAIVFCVHSEDGTSYRQSLCDDEEIEKPLREMLTKLYGEPTQSFQGGKKVQ